MWALKRLDGTIFRDGFNNQWEAVRIACDETGHRFKKNEALQLKAGTVVLRTMYIPVSIAHETDKGIVHRKMNAERQFKLILTEYNTSA